MLQTCKRCQNTEDHDWINSCDNDTDNEDDGDSDRLEVPADAQAPDFGEGPDWTDDFQGPQPPLRPDVPPYSTSPTTHFRDPVGSVPPSAVPLRTPPPITARGLLNRVVRTHHRSRVRSFATTAGWGSSMFVNYNCHSPVTLLVYRCMGLPHANHLLLCSRLECSPNMQSRCIVSARTQFNWKQKQ
jgi:hypothetical protein